MYQRLFARDLFNDLERFQRELSGALDPAASRQSARAAARGDYPALNVGLSPEAVEVYAFAPGLDPATVSVDLDRGVLSLAGERASVTSAKVEAKRTVDGDASATAAATDTASANAQAAAAAPAAEPKPLVHQAERFSGRFRRVVSLPDDIDPEQVTASYRDGVLRVSIKRRAAAQPRRIDIH